MPIFTESCTLYNLLYNNNNNFYRIYFEHKIMILLNIKFTLARCSHAHVG